MRLWQQRPPGQLWLIWPSMMQVTSISTLPQALTACIKPHMRPATRVHFGCPGSSGMLQQSHHVM